MKKKVYPLLLAIALCLALSLTACGDNGGTASANTSVPPTSPAVTATPAPTSTPEPAEPECEHDWTEANYQEPKTCAICGETEGNPLTPAFEEYGYAINMAVETAYDYKTICQNDPSKDATAKVTITDHKTIESDETHEGKDGYEWRIVRAYCEVDGEDANAYGVRLREVLADYYTGSLLFADEPFILNYNNEEYECIVAFNEIQGEWVAGGVGGHTFVYDYEYSALVPVGYDGCVFVLYNAVHGSSEVNELGSVTNLLTDIVDEDTLFFRMAD